MRIGTRAQRRRTVHAEVPAAPAEAAADPAGMDSAPDWIAESVRVAADEARLYVRTAAAFTLRPGRFTEAWAAGRQEAMNPLGFLATAMVGVSVVRSLALWAAGVLPAGGWGDELLHSVGPVLHYTALGLLCHVVLRVLGPSRRRASDSVALALYAAGGPGALAEATVWACALLLSAIGWADVTPATVSLGLGVALGAFCYALGYSLGTLHLARWWHMPLAFGAAFVITGLVFGLVDPPGQYGVHWIFTLTDAQGDFRPGLRLGL